MILPRRRRRLLLPGGASQKPGARGVPGARGAAAPGRHRRGRGREESGRDQADAAGGARALLRRVGGTLVHVHTTTGQRASYRPYLAASHELHGLLASAELARDVSGDGFNGVAVEKASIDEAYVQLPTGSDLRVDGARCADVIRDVVKARLGIVVSVGVAHNKLLAKLAAASAKPDGRRVIVSREDIADLLASTPAHELPGCGGALAAKIRAALGPNATVARLARLPESALCAALGANPATARLSAPDPRASATIPCAGGARNLNKSVGVHTSLALTPRAMYGVPGCGVSASGGRPGMFEPLGCRETGRLDSLLRAMASDLAGRVIDLAHAEKRWPRTMTVSLILVLGRSESGDGEEVRCSKRGPFPDRDPRVRKRPSSPDTDGRRDGDGESRARHRGGARAGSHREPRRCARGEGVHHRRGVQSVGGIRRRRRPRLVPLRRGGRDRAGAGAREPRERGRCQRRRGCGERRRGRGRRR